MESTVMGRLRVEVHGGTQEISSSKVPIADSAVVVGCSKGCTLVLEDSR
jgi:hypothetical protein